MKLYGHMFSTCTRKVLLTMKEKGVETQFINIELAKGEHKKPEHMARHPYGVVPVFEDGDLRMIESRAICRYLDARFLNSSLTPTDLNARAKMEQWCYFEQAYVDPAFGKLFFQKVLGPMRGHQIDYSIVETAKSQIRYAFQILDQQLRSQPYLAGEQFTLADIFMMPYHQHLVFSNEGELMNEFVHLSAWWKRVSQRPSWKQFEK